MDEIHACSEPCMLLGEVNGATVTTAHRRC